MGGLSRKMWLDMKRYCKICATQNKNITVLFMIEDPEKNEAPKSKKYDFHKIRDEIKN